MESLRRLSSLDDGCVSTEGVHCWPLQLGEFSDRSGLLLCWKANRGTQLDAQEKDAGLVRKTLLSVGAPRGTWQDNSGDPHRIMFRLQDGNTSHDELFPLARGVSADHSNAEHA